MRRARSALFLGFCIAATVLSAGFLFLILGATLYRGWPAISLQFLTQESAAFGHAGGIFYQMAGTVLLIGGAGVLSLPVAFGTAVYQTEYLRARYKRWASALIYALNGVPTILFGLFGYLVFGVTFGWGISWLTGSFVLAMMMVPTTAVSIKEAIESIPLKYREAGLALGLTRWGLIRAVIVPHSLFGIVTGLLLGLARAAGETAAILFTATAFSGVTLPDSFFEPVTSLQTHIFILSQESLNPVAQANAWGAALVLILLVLTLNIGSLLVRRKIVWEAEH